MKKKLLGVAAFLLSLNAYAAEEAAWMRYCAISPDGSQIAFSYKGDIYTVPTTGGRANQITPIPYGVPTDNRLPLPATDWEAWTSMW